MPLIVPPVPMPATNAVIRPLGLLPQLRAGALVVRERVVRVGVLVRAPRARGVGDLLARHRVVRARILGRDGGRADQHLGAVRAKDVDLLGADLVGHREDALVAPLSGHDREPDTGVAAGRLHDGAARPELSLALGGFDHDLRDPVLHRAARIDVFELGVDGAGDALGDLREPDQRRVADQLRKRFNDYGHLDAPPFGRDRRFVLRPGASVEQCRIAQRITSVSIRGFSLARSRRWRHVSALDLRLLGRLGGAGLLAGALALFALKALPHWNTAGGTVMVAVSILTALGGSLRYARDGPKRPPPPAWSSPPGRTSPSASAG